MSAKVSVLVVDDDFDARNLLALALSVEGYAVMSATNGAEALAVARRHRPGVILLDLAMPVMDGFAFREEQLRDPVLADIPVICVSGRHDAGQATRNLKFAGCVAKPFALDEIVLRVGDLVDRFHPPPGGTSPAGKPAGKKSE